MLAVLQNADAARAEHFAGLRKTAKQEAEALTKAARKKRAASRAAAAPWKKGKPQS